MTIVDLIKAQALKHPERKAVVYPGKRDSQGRYNYRHETFLSLECKSQRLAQQLQALGIEKGMLTLLFVRPSLEFPIVSLALLKIGAVPIMIDPGMGRKNLLLAVEEVAPKALIAVDEVHYLRCLFPKGFKNVTIAITTGKWTPWATRLSALLESDPPSDAPEPSLHLHPADLAAILFTSGGTGKPKGVCYSHEVFTAQVRLLSQLFGLKPGSSDMPGFPLFALMTIAMGVTSVIPPMNPSRPAKASPELLVDVIREQGVKSLGGSPAIWERVAEHCLKKDLKLKSVKSLMMFGAPVPVRILENFSGILPNGESYTPYGATECLPVTCISGSKILTETREKSEKGYGTCVGLPAPDTQIRIIAPTKGPIETISQAKELPPNEIGEIIVKGAQVTLEYFKRPDDSRLAKVKDQDGSIWHRMGDLGAIDELGRLWFCGRKAHVVEAAEGETYYSVPCEAIFNQHPKVRRSALVAASSKTSPGKKAVVVIECFDQSTRKSLTQEQARQLREELGQLARRFAHTQSIADFYLWPSFPVDPRHNIKIDRKALGNLISQTPACRL